MTRYEIELTDEQARAFESTWPEWERPQRGASVTSTVSAAYLSGAFAIADAIRANPPKPAEPTGFGAMVKDRDGTVWLRTAHERMPWCSEEFMAREYADIDAVEVIR